MTETIAAGPALLARPGRLAPRRPSRLPLPVFALSLGTFLFVLLVLAGSGFYDIQTYRAEGFTLRAGHDLYGPLVGRPGLATYPPFAAMLFVALTPLSPLATNLVSVVGNVVLLCFVCWLSLRLVEPRRVGLRAALLVAAIAPWLEPVYTTFRYGQINLAVLALVLWDVTRHPSARWRGVGIGLATALKVTPGLFIVYLLLTRRFRVAVTALVTLGGTVACSGLADRSATTRYWTRYLFDPHRVGRLENAANQSLRGMFVRLDHSRVTRPGELIVIGTALVAGLVLATIAYRRLGEAWGVSVCAVTALLSAPIAWSHHWVWCVPIGVLLWFRARVLAWIGLVVFGSFAIWWVPHARSAELHFSAVQLAASGWYVAFGVLFLAFVAHRLLFRSATGTARATRRGTPDARSRWSTR